MPRRRSLRLPVLALVVLALGALAWLLSDPGESWRARWRTPRVVVVTLDTLNWKYTSPLQSEVEFTPALQELADQGVVFEHAYAPVPLTLPSHTSLFSGLRPTTTGVMANGDQVPPQIDLLPEVFRRSGYTAGAFISLGVLKPNFGLARGFDHYDAALEEPHRRWYRTADEVVGAAGAWVEEQGDDPFFLWVHLSDPHEPYLLKDTPEDTELQLDGKPLGKWTLGLRETVTQEVRLPPGRHRLTFRSLLAARNRFRPAVQLNVRNLLSELEPWLVLPPGELSTVLLLPDLDLELDNPTGEAVDLTLTFTGKLVRKPRKYTRRKYQETVAYADRYLAELRALFAQRGWDEKTLWVVVADHGEGVSGNRGSGHAAFVFEDQMRILWLLAGPGVPRQRVLRQAPAQIEDVLPTVLDLVGLDLPPQLDGVSRRPCWRSSPPEGCISSEDWWAFGVDDALELAGIAGYSWPFKWVWHPDWGAMAFDVAQDPKERRNLLSGNGTAEGLSEADRAVLERLGREGPRRRQALLRRFASRAGGGLTNEDRQMLESLGYL